MAKKKNNKKNCFTYLKITKTLKYNTGKILTVKIEINYNTNIENNIFFNTKLLLKNNYKNTQ